MTECEIVQALRNNEPFKGLPNVRVANLVDQLYTTQRRFDAKFDLQFGDMKVEVYVEVKSTCTPKQVEQIAPWLSQMKAMKNGAAFALLCPTISPQSQELCFKRNVDFIDLAGNVFINIPGKLLLQRVGMKPQREATASYYRNPFSGTSSRILRVLLQKPKPWTLSEIAEELAAETRRVQCPGTPFGVSLSLTSRVLRSLEEELLVIRKPTAFDPDLAVSEADLKQERSARRRNAILVPEPEKLLNTWAREYKDRYRWYLRRSFKAPNPFGSGLQTVNEGLWGMLRSGCYAFTGAAAASLTAPFIDADPIEFYIAGEIGADKLRPSLSGVGVGPDLRVIYPFDAGVFMYSTRVNGIPVVSDIQAYLDLFARGGRDLKQADYLLQQRIAPMWRSK